MLEYKDGAYVQANWRCKVIKVVFPLPTGFGSLSRHICIGEERETIRQTAENIINKYLTTSFGELGQKEQLLKASFLSRIPVKDE